MQRCNRRELLRLAGVGTVATTLGACGSNPEPNRYTAADIALLARQRQREARLNGSVRPRPTAVADGP